MTAESLEYWVRISMIVTSVATFLYMAFTLLMACFTKRMADSSARMAEEMKREFDVDHTPVLWVFVQGSHPVQDGSLPPHMTFAVTNLGRTPAYHPRFSPQWVKGQESEYSDLKDSPGECREPATVVSDRFLLPDQTRYFRLPMPAAGDTVRVAWERVTGKPELWRIWEVSQLGPPQGGFQVLLAEQCPELVGLRGSGAE